MRLAILLSTAALLLSSTASYAKKGRTRGKSSPRRAELMKLRSIKPGTKAAAMMRAKIISRDLKNRALLGNRVRVRGIRTSTYGKRTVTSKNIHGYSRAVTRASFEKAAALNTKMNRAEMAGVAKAGAALLRMNGEMKVESRPEILSGIKAMTLNSVRLKNGFQRHHRAAIREYFELTREVKGDSLEMKLIKSAIVQKRDPDKVMRRCFGLAI